MLFPYHILNFSPAIYIEQFGCFSSCILLASYGILFERIELGTAQGGGCPGVRRQ